MNTTQHTDKVVDAHFDIEELGTLIFEEREIPLSEAEWRRLEAIVEASDYDRIIGGDAAEEHAVWVSRYFNDIRSPTALNQQADEVASILMSRKMRDFYARFTGTPELCLRRCQANRMAAGDFIGMHKDQDSSPLYFATIVFHLKSDYEGGVFRTADDRRYRPGKRMALVNNCSISHEVTPVAAGERVTLACFLSRDFSENDGERVDFRVDTH